MARGKKESDQEFFARLINKMFEIADCDMRYQTLVDNKEIEDARSFGEKWYQRYTWNKEQEAEFREWARVEFKKRFKYLSKNYLERELAFFLLSYGLKRSDYEYEKLI